MKIGIFSFREYEEPFLKLAFDKLKGIKVVTQSAALNAQTIALAHGCEACCCFVSDDLSQTVIEGLAKAGVKLIALRSAGFNHVDIEAAKKAGITVMRVPAYSPYAVAEFAVGLILALNRKYHRAYAHVQEHNFSLNGLMGFDLHGKTVGVVGTGKIGRAFARIMLGFGCHVLATDIEHDPELVKLGVSYVTLESLYQHADIISLHCPLYDKTKHLINKKAIASMKDGVMLINTSRGGLIHTAALIDGLKSGKIGYLGLDVYEEEEHLFFRDLSNTVIHDDVYLRLQTFPNVMLTGHQAFFTAEAMTRIYQTTADNVRAYSTGALGTVADNMVV